MLVLWLRLLCIVWASARAARWPRPVPEGESRDGEGALLPTLTTSLRRGLRLAAPPDAPPPRAGPLREWQSVSGDYSPRTIAPKGPVCLGRRLGQINPNLQSIFIEDWDE